jgi:hypothetical protein
MGARETVLEELLSLLRKIQMISGREVPADMDEETIPIGGLPGFDSLNGIEFTSMLPPTVRWAGQNLCVSEDGKRALTVGEMVDRLREREEAARKGGEQQ